jgi:fermentation-respiration switch protein FrsA (DUF1100 family)
MNERFRVARRLVGGAAVAYLLLCGATWLLQRRLLYFPGFPPSPRLPSDSVAAGLEEVRAQTEDGLALSGWWWPGESGATLLVFGGNASNRMALLPWARTVHSRLGASLLLADYRGYGDNPGAPTEEGLYLDALAWRAWLEGRATGPIVYLGTSLGSGVAVELATRHTPDALILESPFTSAVDVGAAAYPFLPVRLLQKDRYENISKVSALPCPLLVLHGVADPIVPVEHGRALVAAAGGPARLVEIPGAGHEDLLHVGGERWLSAVEELLAGLR